MNEIQSQILIGLMLGDGHLEMHKNGKNASLKITRKTDDKNYLLYHSKIFESFKNSVKDREIYDKRTNKIYYQSKLATLSNKEFTELHSKWYINRIKTIPKDLDLTPIILATWFADDGCITMRKRKYDIKLATHGFTFEEVKFLQQKLKDQFNLELKIYEDKSGKKKCWTLRVTNKATLKKFVDIIDPVFPEGMERKSNIWKENYNFLIPKKIPACPICKLYKVYKNGRYKNKLKFNCLICKKCFYE